MEFWVATAIFSAVRIKKRGAKIACTVIFSLLAAVFAVYIAATFILVAAVD